MRVRGSTKKYVYHIVRTGENPHCGITSKLAVVLSEAEHHSLIANPAVGWRACQ